MTEDNQFSIGSSATRRIEPLPKEKPSIPLSVQAGFKTPNETAARDAQATADPIIGHLDTKKQKAKTSRLQKLKISWPPSKKQWLVIAALIIVLGGGGYFGYQQFFSAKPTPVAAKKVIAVVAKKPPVIITSNLSGLPISSAALNQLPVTAVMIENSLDARPQSGLSSAGVVFEAVAEGGVTRFMALYQDTSPANVGPIRSARPYYIGWSMGFDAGYAHVGGSTDGLADIKSWGVRDLDEFYNAGAYHRISTREAPHNVYTSIADLNQLEDSKGYTSSQYTSWTRQTGAPEKTPTATAINLNLSGPDYNVVYNYNAKTDTYDRSEGGAPQIDANTNTQLSPKVVIAIVVPETQGALDSSGAYYSNYNYLGSGTAYIFQDGTEIQGQWTKSANNSQILFTTATGKTIPLDAGQVWISAITSASGVSSS